MEKEEKTLKIRKELIRQYCDQHGYRLPQEEKEKEKKQKEDE